MSGPKAVVAEHGIEVPDNIEVNVVENSDNSVHVTIPKVATHTHALSDEQLSQAVEEKQTGRQGGDEILADTCEYASKYRGISRQLLYMKVTGNDRATKHDGGALRRMLEGRRPQGTLHE